MVGAQGVHAGVSTQGKTTGRILTHKLTVPDAVLTGPPNAPPIQNSRDSSPLSDGPDEVDRPAFRERTPGGTLMKMVSVDRKGFAPAMTFTSVVRQVEESAAKEQLGWSSLAEVRLLFRIVTDPGSTPTTVSSDGVLDRTVFNLLKKSFSKDQSLRGIEVRPANNHDEEDEW